MDMDTYVYVYVSVCVWVCVCVCVYVTFIYFVVTCISLQEFSTPKKGASRMTVGSSFLVRSIGCTLHTIWSRGGGGEARGEGGGEGRGGCTQGTH